MKIHVSKDKKKGDFSMKYIFKGKGISITTPMQDAAIASLFVLDKFLEKEHDCTITIEKSGLKVVTTLLFNYNGETIKISNDGVDYYSAMDTLGDIAKSKMERLHARVVTKKHSGNTKVLLHEDEDGNFKSDIIKRKFIRPSQITEEEAIEQMNLYGHPSFIFQNADMEGTMCLLYKRNAGSYGILEMSK